jgi:hypothetical protein
MTDEVVKELYRSRWRRAREPLGLVDPGRDDFATGGLGRLCAAPYSSFACLARRPRSEPARI